MIRRSSFFGLGAMNSLSAPFCKTWAFVRQGEKQGALCNPGCVLRDCEFVGIDALLVMEKHGAGLSRRRGCFFARLRFQGGGCQCRTIVPYPTVPGLAGAAVQRLGVMPRLVSKSLSSRATRYMR